MNKKEILRVLNDWNYWNKEPNFTNRDIYKKKIENLRNTKEIICLTGIRRTGKSTLLLQEISSLKKTIKPNQILFVNLEDPRLLELLDNKGLEIIFNTYKELIHDKGEIFLFLDEIQNVNNWEKWVRTKYELKEANIYITGSSSKLLSKEISTSLSGRTIQLEVFPLSFKEFLFFKNLKIEKKLDLINSEIIIKKYFNEYLKDGGFPKIVNLDSENKKELLINYFNTIILKDIVSRHNLRDEEKVKKVTYYLLSNLTKLYSINNIRKSANISLEATSRYIEYLKEVYLIFELNKFDFSVKKQENALKKIYAIDLGLANKIAFKFTQDFGRLLENLVFIQLKRNNHEIYYHKQKHECDFLIKEGLKISQAIQVTKELNEENKKREIKGLLEALTEHNLKKGLILTEEQEDEMKIENKLIKIKPIWKWLIE